jgi:hypothetical protein
MDPLVDTNISEKRLSLSSGLKMEAAFLRNVGVYLRVHANRNTDFTSNACVNFVYFKFTKRYLHHTNANITGLTCFNYVLIQQELHMCCACGLNMTVQGNVLYRQIRAYRPLESRHVCSANSVSDDNEILQFCY